MPDRLKGLHVFAGYEAEFVPAAPDPAAPEGSATQLVIALTALQKADRPITVFDFYGSLMQRPGIDRIFIRDQPRSWYNAEPGWDALVAAVQAYAAGRPYRQVTVVGISMGAYGALLLGALLPGARVVALDPSISVDTARYGRGIIRHPNWFDAGGAQPRRDAVMTGDPGRYLCLFGDQDVWDVVNARHFFEQGWPHVFLCPDGSHELGVHLKTRGRFAGFMDRLLDGAPAPALAAAAGAYLAFSHCQAFTMLEARRLLYAGDLPGADRQLHYAAIAPAEAVPRSLAALVQLRDALEPPGRDMLRRFLADPGPAVTLELADGWTASFSSPTARRIGPEMAQLGPLALLRLQHPDPTPGRIRLRLKAGAPPGCNAGGSLALAALLPDPDKPRSLAVAETPETPLHCDLTLQEGAATLLLHRRCFYSLFDAERGSLRSVWAMRVSGVQVKRLPPKPAAGPAPAEPATA